MFGSNPLAKFGAIAAVATLALSACGTTDTGDNTAEGECKGKIAIMGALSGSNASIVLPSVDGAKLALDQFKAANPDCDITIEEFDSEGDPAKATPLANKIAADESFIGVIGGGFSGETRATKPIYQAAGVVMVSQSATAADLTKDNVVDVFHRVIANDDVQGVAIASYLKDIASAKSVFVVSDDSTYGQGLGAIVTSTLGDVVVGSDNVKTGQTEFSATVSQIKAAKPDWVFYAGYTAEAAPFLKQLRNADVKSEFLGGDGVYGADFPTGAGAAAEGATITCPCLPVDQVAGTFAADFQSAYGEPGAYAAEGFDAMNIFLQGFLDGNSTRASMLEWVNGYNADGLTKHYEFDENGDVGIENVVVWSYKVEGGKIVPEQEIPIS